MNRPIRVGLVAPLPPPYGGIANWTRLMCENVPTDVHYEIIDISPGKRATEGRNLFNRIFVSGLGIFEKKWKLIQLIRHKKIDVIHMTTSGQFAVVRDLALLRYAKKKKIPCVYHIHFGRIPTIAKENSKEWKLIYKAMRLADNVIVIDQKTFECLNKYDDINRSYIPNPIILEENNDEIIKPQREVLFMGWCIKTKGIEELLEAWGKIAVKHKDWTLRLVGPYNKKYMDELKERYNFKNIIVCGEKEHEEALEMMKHADIFVLPSYTEGFPNVILEAMEYGKAIIGTDVGAISEMLSGNAGVVINPYSSDEVMTALDRLISADELRKQLGDTAYLKVRRNYSFDIVMNQYMDLWKQIIKR